MYNNLVCRVCYSGLDLSLKPLGVIRFANAGEGASNLNRKK